MPNASLSVPPRFGLGSADASRPRSTAAGVGPAAGAATAGAAVAAGAGAGSVARVGGAVGTAVGGGGAGGAGGAAGPQAARKVAMVLLAKPSALSRCTNCRRLSLPVRNDSKAARLRASKDDMCVLPLAVQHYHDRGLLR